MAAAASATPWSNALKRSSIDSCAPSAPRPVAAVPRTTASELRSAFLRASTAGVPLVLMRARAAARRISSDRCCTYGATAGLSDTTFSLAAVFIASSRTGGVPPWASSSATSGAVSGLSDSAMALSAAMMSASLPASCFFSAARSARGVASAFRSLADFGLA